FFKKMSGEFLRERGEVAHDFLQLRMRFAVSVNHLLEQYRETGDLVADIAVMLSDDVLDQCLQRGLIPRSVVGIGRGVRRVLQQFDYLFEGQVAAGACVSQALLASAAVVDAELLEYAQIGRAFGGEFSYGLVD